MRTCLAGNFCAILKKTPMNIPFVGISTYKQEKAGAAAPAFLSY